MLTSLHFVVDNTLSFGHLWLLWQAVTSDSRLANAMLASNTSSAPCEESGEPHLRRSIQAALLNASAELRQLAALASAWVTRGPSASTAKILGAAVEAIEQINKQHLNDTFAAPTQANQHDASANRPYGQHGGVGDSAAAAEGTTANASEHGGTPFHALKHWKHATPEAVWHYK